MDIETKFEQIKRFLLKHQFLHEIEPLERYPLTANPYSTWIEDLVGLSQQELIELENDLDDSLISNSEYKYFLQEIRDLIELPQFREELSSFPNRLKRKVSEKKRHEIQVIKTQLAAYEINQFIDIGSGAGHLSSVLLDQNKKKSTLPCGDSLTT